MSNDERNSPAGKESYWQDYYSRRASAGMPLPSQFSVFVAGELGERHQVFDIGCGGGRDSMLFASRGHRVTGVDGSQAAVSSCMGLAANSGTEDATFVCSPITDSGLAARIQPNAELPVVVYARFFLHALTEEEEGYFFRLARELTRDGDTLALEFRTMRDRAQEKVTDSHYRRFIDPVEFNARAMAHGFVTTYFVEGFGFAKYKQDDAHVARFLFRRKSVDGE